MLSFFYKHKKVRGVITVFLTLAYLSIYSVTGLLVDGGRVRMARTIIEDVQQVATENVMSQYNRGLYEYYGLFGITDYYPDDIAADVQAQIEESIGLKFRKDAIKEFIEDLSVGASSAKNNLGVVSSSENLAEGVTELNKRVSNDLSESKKRFDPYGIEVGNISATRIDLTDVEVMRAQIRDEMRYTAIPVLMANFFSVIEEFLSISDAAETVSKVAKTIEEVNKKRKATMSDYYKMLNKFSDGFHKYVRTCYEMNDTPWGKMDAPKGISDAINLILATSPGAHVVNFIVKFFTKKDIIEEATNLAYDIATDMHYGLEGGVDNVIKNHADRLARFYKEFDIEQGWPLGKDSKKEVADTSTNTNNTSTTNNNNTQESAAANETKPKKEVYDEEAHRAAIMAEADKRRSDYIKGVNELLKELSETLENMHNAQKMLKVSIDAADEAEGIFYEGYNNGQTSEKSKAIYEKSMETYLYYWNELRNQEKILDNFEEKLKKLDEILKKSKDDVDVVYESIINEPIDENWKYPKLTSSKLSNKREADKEEFSNIMISLCIKDGGIEILKSFQDTAEGDKATKNIFSLLSTIFSSKQNEEDGVVSDSNKALFGKITPHAASENELPSNIDSDLEELSEDNLITTISKIMDQAMNIVSSITTGLKNNLYDEAYILTHCRDYVHTLKYSQLTDAQKNDPDIDTILNPKFIKDQSSTKYLSNQQFNSIQHTPAEIEYILWGMEDTKLNVGIMYANIFIIRLALNYIAALTSPRSSAQGSALAAGAGIFAPIVKFATPLIYAIPQSIFETKDIMVECKKIKLWNGGPNLDLWDAVGDRLGKKLADAAKKAKDEIINAGKEALKHIDTAALITAAWENGPTPNVENAIIVLSGKIIGYKPEDIDSPRVPEVSYPENASSETDFEVKVGYTDFLLIYLFINGALSKNSQINKLQDVIEVNMRKEGTGQPEFRLKNTYSQVAIEGNYSLKYLFMTQSFMRRTFSSTSNYNRYPIKIKTAFAY